MDDNGLQFSINICFLAERDRQVTLNITALHENDLQSQLEYIFAFIFGKKKKRRGEVGGE